MHELSITNDTEARSACDPRRAAPSHPHDRHLRAWGWLAALVAVALFTLFTWIRLHHGDTELFVSDGYYYYSYLPSWWIDHDLDLSNQYEHRPEQAAAWGRLPTATGRPSNPFAIGMAALLSPAFLLTRAANLGRGDGWSLSYQLPVCALAFLYSLAGVAITFCLLRRLFPARTSALTAAALALGTCWTAYIFCEPNMSHGVSAAAVAAFLYTLVWAAERPRVLRMLLAGVLLGLAALVRTQNLLLLFLVLPVLGRRGLKYYPIIALAALAMLVPQALTWHAIYGKWVTVPQGHGFMQWSHPAPLAMLFSTNHGLFMWSPLLLLAVAGFLVFPPRLRGLATGCAVVLVAQIYVNAAAQDWWAGWAFGMRRMVDTMPLFAVGFAALASVAGRWPRTRRALVAESTILVSLNACQVWRYYSHDLPPVGVVSLQRLWGDALKYPLNSLARHGASLFSPVTVSASSSPRSPAGRAGR
jgi:hypothetical protein